MTEALISSLRDSLDPVDMPDTAHAFSQTHRAAAVLVPLVMRGGEYHLIFTERAHHLSNHAGQISFPGGGIQSDDPHPAAAALRETREEIGVAEPEITLLGRYQTADTPSGFRITPFVGVVSSAAQFTADPGEVEDIFEAPFSFFMDAANHNYRELEFEGRTRNVIEMPWQDRYIWGVTAYLLKTLHQRLDFT